MARTTGPLALAFAVGLVAWLAFALLSREKNLPLRESGEPAARTLPAAADLTLPPPSPSRSDLPQSAPAASQDAAPLRPPPLELSSGPLAWERQIAHASARGRDAAGKAREIFALIPRLPEEALAGAAEQAVERLPNSDYAAIALPVVIHPQTSGQVLSVLFADLMERPDAITLPALLSIAKNPAHPFSPAALDNLHLLLGQNFGSDWTKWDEAVQRAAALPRQ